MNIAYKLLLVCLTSYSLSQASSPSNSSQSSPVDEYLGSYPFDGLASLGLESSDDVRIAPVVTPAEIDQFVSQQYQLLLSDPNFVFGEQDPQILEQDIHTYWDNHGYPRGRGLASNHDELAQCLVDLLLQPGLPSVERSN